jgi:hypothetical protein
MISGVIISNVLHPDDRIAASAGLARDRDLPGAGEAARAYRR